MEQDVKRKNLSHPRLNERASFSTEQSRAREMRKFREDIESLRTSVGNLNELYADIRIRLRDVEEKQRRK